MLTSHEIRTKFIQFFESKGHTFVKGAPIVVKGDPTLMFTNAGMNQFKDYFLGNSIAPYKRAVNSQKCLRVSGKHNDLEEVGHDHYHHTMFEMLGNWSFGDFFKKDAIAWAWELLTDVYKLPASQLYVTVFEGDESSNIDFDQDAFNYWNQYFPADRILKGNKKDNFWEMGDTGPCGPCTEIHFDMRSEAERAAINGADLVNNDHPEVVEIWNLVFMEFNRLADGSLVRLPAQHVDTGMGFERLVRGIQRKTSNYDTDVFQFIIQETSKLSGKTYGENEKQDIAFRVIADHIRAVSMCIADGQLPSNNGAGYVVRRILRRAARYGYSYLGFTEPFFHKLIPGLANYFQSAFPELKSQESFVMRVVKEEEVSFFRTLSTGMQRLTALMTENDTQIISGEVAFELYDTFGFPIDLTDLVARENGFSVDMVVFQRCLDEQKNRSKADASKQMGDWQQIHPDSEETFCGYDVVENQTTISRYRTVTVKGDKQQFQLVLDNTPFYAESGGQVGDTGIIKGVENGEILRVTNTVKDNKLHIHLVDKLPVNPSQNFIASVDKSKRNLISSNHSATHLMHSALRETLGSHVAQKGSLVNSEYLRFDFSHFGKMTEEELAQVEARVNEQIRASIPLQEHRNIPINEATAMGATALFGEKYGDFVRVIEFDRNYSLELCGGTHVNNTAEIGLFKITSESSVAAGVRRIEAITNQGAQSLINNRLQLLVSIEQALNNAKDPVQAIEKILQENADLKSKLEAIELSQIASIKQSLKSSFNEVNGMNLLIKSLELPSADAAKQLCFQLKNEIDNAIIGLVFLADGKPGIALYIDEDLVGKREYNASTIVREVAKNIQGGGGGQPFFATAGGKDVSGIENAVAALKRYFN